MPHPSIKFHMWSCACWTVAMLNTPDSSLNLIAIGGCFVFMWLGRMSEKKSLIMQQAIFDMLQGQEKVK